LLGEGDDRAGGRAAEEPADLQLDLDGLSGHCRVSKPALIPALDSSGRSAAAAASGLSGVRPGSYPQASSGPLDLLDHDTSEVRQEHMKITKRHAA